MNLAGSTRPEESGDPGDMIQFGKHKGKSFAEVFIREPNYVEWVLLQENVTGQLKAFQDFVRAQETRTKRPYASIWAGSQFDERGPTVRQSITPDKTTAPCTVHISATYFQDSLKPCLRIEGWCPKWREINSMPGLKMKQGSSREWLIDTQQSLSSRMSEISQNLIAWDLNVDDATKWLIDLMDRQTKQSTTLPSFPRYFQDFPEQASQLLPYQNEGIKFGISRSGRVLIGDEMGLGKSLQAIAISYEYFDEWPLLVVCPASIRFVWQEQLARWLPLNGLSAIQVITKATDTISSSSRIVIVGYPMISKPQFQTTPSGRPFSCVICDESHYLKSMQTARTKALMPILSKARRAILLSGTPALNRAEELYPQLSSLLPSCPSLGQFRERYCVKQIMRFGGKMVEKWGGCARKEELHSLLSICMLRRTKKEVMEQLPEKRRHRVTLEAVSSWDQEEAKKLRDLWMKEPEVQSEQGSSLLEMWRLTGQCKLPQAREYVRELLADCEDKMLIFAHHRIVLDGLEAELEESGTRYVRIDGSTSQEVRAANVGGFQDHTDCRVALLSITACAEGITLTAASLVVFCELYWVPGVLEQAEARAHRIGQKNSSVMVHFLVLPNSPDEVVFASLERKKRDTSVVLDGKQEGLKCSQTRVAKRDEMSSDSKLSILVDDQVIDVQDLEAMPSWMS